MFLLASVDSNSRSVMLVWVRHYARRLQWQLEGSESGVLLTLSWARK